MSRPSTAPSRTRLERAQSSPGRARVVERGEVQTRDGQEAGGVELEEDHSVAQENATVEITELAPRRSADIEELQSGDEIEELTSVHDEEPGTSNNIPLILPT